MGDTKGILQAHLKHQARGVDRAGRKDSGIKQQLFDSKLSKEKPQNKLCCA